jgi:hypothetical protein
MKELTAELTSQRSKRATLEVCGSLPRSRRFDALDQAKLRKLTGSAPVSPAVRVVDHGGLLEMDAGVDGIELDLSE